MHLAPLNLGACDAYAEAEQLLPMVTPLASRRNMTEVLADPLYRCLPPALRV